MRATAGLLLLTAALCASTMRAQQMTDVTPGTRVRVETTDGVLLTGRLTYRSADTLWLSTDRGATTMPYALSSVRRYERSLGVPRKRNAGRGAMVGGGIGLGLVAYAIYQDRTETSAVTIPTTVVAVPAALLLTGVGALLGVATGTERWTTPTRLSVGVVPGVSPRPSIGIRVAF